MNKKHLFVLCVTSLLVVSCGSEEASSLFSFSSSTNSSETSITSSSVTDSSSIDSQTSESQQSETSEDTNEPQQSESSEEVVSSSEDASSSSETSSQQIPDRESYILLEDQMPYYYVGETFNQVFDYKVTLVEKGKSTDVSNRMSSFDISIKDKNGTAIDINKPFESAGKYDVTFSITGKKTGTVVYSDPLEITVKSLPTTSLTNKKQIDKDLNYSEFENSCLSNLSFPTTGTINALVIPVEITDFPFTSSNYGSDYHDKIEAAFKGNGEADTLYWESVSSYYKKSSFNQLDIQFDVADTYHSSYSSSMVVGSGTGAVFGIANSALDSYRSAHGNDSLKKYDNDKDGYIDGLWLVYSAPDYSEYNYGFGGDVFWAFCTDTLSYNSNVNNPQLHSLGWASIDFLTKGAEAPKVDAHTFIHETGHLFGLPDYYSYDKNGAKSAGSQGGLAMMDLNIGDHEAFSKLALGWTDPYVATGDAVVTLKSNTLTGECLVLADHWNGTAFDEYVLVDFVTPEGLNVLDSTEKYTTWPLYFTKSGIRLYHVDARLGEFKYCYPGEDGAIYEGVKPIKNGDSYYLNDAVVEQIVEKGKVDRVSKDPLASLEERGSGYTVLNANSSTRNLIEETEYNTNRLLTLMNPQGTNFEIKDSYADDDSLFYKGQSWSLNHNSLSFFNNANRTLNNGNKLGWSVTVLSIEDDQATILVKKY